MASTLLSLIQRLYPLSTDSARVMFTGLDYSGKTTLLYLLKLGEVVTTIPGLGFNVENIELTTSSNKRLKMDAWDVGAGCGGPSMMRTMLRHYLPNTTALIWIVDSADRQRMSECVEVLRGVLSDLESEPDAEKRHVPVLVLANKTDLPNCMSLDEIRMALSKVLSGHISSIYPTSLTKKPPTGIQEAFDWLALALDIAKTTQKTAGSEVPAVKSPAAAGASNPRDPSGLAGKLEEWFRRTEADSSPEDFIAQFQVYQLPSWDHYTHIRLAFLILVANGRQKGKDILFKGLSDYIANSSHTNGRAFHFTMTYFWLQIVHFGIRNLPENIAPQPRADSDVDGQISYPTSTDFFRFLFVNPHVVDGGLWLEYYSKDMMMSPEAKARMVLPDKKPLPNLVIRDAVNSFGAKSST